MGKQEKRDLVLAPGTYAYMQDETTGVIKTFVGPCVINQTAQEVPVRYVTSEGAFRRCNRLEEATCTSPIAVEGYYLVLKNPVRHGEEHPDTGSAGKSSPLLQVGRKINIPGPCMFALWPGQDAQVVRGHNLRSNQYLLVRIYNEEEARSNWEKAVMKPASGPEMESGETLATAPAPVDLNVGKELVIKGTEVSFYIPPTGIGVVPEGIDRERKPIYVRDALTLERLEYCILVDENGNKRYERGPQVVFPNPTERFIVRKGQKKFRAVELNENQGLHIKVIASYTDESTGQAYREGDELFITGKETAIYFPCEVHSLISYDGKAKHFATAILEGEARYVMDRMTGEIKTVQGPAMLLPDPRHQVIVRRVLSERDVELWYPGNEEAKEYNARLLNMLEHAPTTRAGVISEGDYTRGVRRQQKHHQASQDQPEQMERAIIGEQDLIGDEFSRASSFSQPRTVMLENKFQGVPSIEVWTGYAVQVISKSGERRVIEGPASVLLDYNETLEVLRFSTGCPASSEALKETTYLRTKNDRIKDCMTVVTLDHVPVSVTVSYRVHFEGPAARWFAVDNPVQLLCDFGRHILKQGAKRLSIEALLSDPTELLQEMLLGVSDESGHRVGIRFDENGMFVDEVSILDVSIEDESIGTLLMQSQKQTARSSIERLAAERDVERLRSLEAISREKAEVQQQTRLQLLALQQAYKEREQEAALKAVERAQALEQAKQEQLRVEAALRQQVAELESQTEQLLHQAMIAQRAEELRLEQEQLASQTAAVVEQAHAISPHLVTSLERLADEKLLGSLANGFGELAAAKGVGLLETAKQFFDFLPEHKLQVLHHTGHLAATPTESDTTDKA